MVHKSTMLQSGGGGGGSIGGAIIGGIDTRVLYIDPTGILNQTDMMRVVTDGIEFGADPSFNDVVFGQDRVGGESGFTMRDTDEVLAAYTVGLNLYGYGGGPPSTPNLGFINGKASFTRAVTVNTSDDIDTVFNVLNFFGTSALSVITGSANQGVVSTAFTTLDNGAGNMLMTTGAYLQTTLIQSDDNDLTVHAVSSGMLNLTGDAGVNISGGAGINMSTGSGNITLSPSSDVNLDASAGSINMTSGGIFTVNGSGTANWQFSGIPEIDLSNSDITDSLGVVGSINSIFTSLGGSGNGTKWQTIAALGLLTSIPWETPGTIGSTTPNTVKATTLATTGKLITYNNVAAAGYGLGAQRFQTGADAQTTAFTVGSYTPPARGSFMATGYLNITAVSVDVIKITITFKDRSGTTQTITPLSGLSAVGYNTFNVGEINANNTAITVATVLTTGAGSITYDVGLTITQVG